MGTIQAKKKKQKKNGIWRSRELFSLIKSGKPVKLTSLENCQQRRHQQVQEQPPQILPLDLFNAKLSPKSVVVGTNIFQKAAGQLYTSLHCHHQNDFALRSAAEEIIVMFQ